MGFTGIEESTAGQVRKPPAKWGISAVQRCKWCRVAKVFLPGPGGLRAKFRWRARRAFRPWNFGLGKAGLVIGIQGAPALADGGTPRKLPRKSPEIGLVSDLCEPVRKYGYYPHMIGFHDDRVHGGADEFRCCRGAFCGAGLAEKFGHRNHPAKAPAKDDPRPNARVRIFKPQYSRPHLWCCMMPARLETTDTRADVQYRAGMLS